MKRDQIVHILADTAGREASMLNDTDALQDLGLNSLDWVEMMLRFELDYGIIFTGEEVASLTTIGELVAAVAGKVARAGIGE